MQADAEKQREAKEFEAYENRQENPVDLTGSQSGESCPEADQNENVTPEDFGVHEASLEDPDEGTVNDAVNDHRLSASKDVYGGRKTNMPDEVVITHLKNPATGHIFLVNDTIVRQKHLVPCDENGKLVHDNRVFQRFN